MAQLNDLLVMGQSTLLGPVNINNTLNVTGTVTITKTTDAATTANNGPALIVGGTATSTHIEIDCNEVLAKSNGTTETDLYLGTTTSKVHIGQDNKGNAAKPVYVSSGVITACSSTVGNAAKPVYMSSGTITACSSNIGDVAKPVYMSSGAITACSSTVGNAAKPVYMSSGTIAACSSTVGGTDQPVYMSSGTITVCSSTVGGAESQPVYMSSGTITGMTKVGVAYGGTGKTSWTANRIVYSSAATTLTNASTHYISGTKLAINSTSEPTQNLYVNGTSHFTNTTSWNCDKAAINLRAGHTSYDGIISYQTHGNEAMVFSTKNAVTSFIFVNGEDTVTNIANNRWISLTPGLQIKNNCVSIGRLIANDTSPEAALVVQGVTKTYGPIFGYNYNVAGNNAPAFIFDKPGSYFTGIGCNGTSDVIYFGPVCSSPGVDLYKWVKDATTALPNATDRAFTQKWKFEGSVEANSYNAVSDLRFKENLRSYTNTNSILNLPIYKFDFIHGQKDQIGCMAQDLREICPEIVCEDAEGYLSIQENKIVYLLIDEVKKLKEEINILKECK